MFGCRDYNNDVHFVPGANLEQKRNVEQHKIGALGGLFSDKFPTSFGRQRMDNRFQALKRSVVGAYAFGQFGPVDAVLRDGARKG